MKIAYREHDDGGRVILLPWPIELLFLLTRCADWVEASWEDWDGFTGLMDIA